MDYVLVSGGLVLVQKYQTDYFLVSLGKQTKKAQGFVLAFSLKEKAVSLQRMSSLTFCHHQEVRMTFGGWAGVRVLEHKLPVYIITQSLIFVPHSYFCHCFIVQYSG